MPNGRRHTTVVVPASRMRAIGGAPALSPNNVGVLGVIAHAHAPGLADVVTNPNGVPVTLTGAFTYHGGVCVDGEPRRDCLRH